MLMAGVFMIAYGPSAVILLAYASRRSALLILTIARCAVWRAAAELGVPDKSRPPLLPAPPTASPGFNSVLRGRPIFSRRHRDATVLCSAFFWLVSVFLTSIIWIAIPPLKVRTRSSCPPTQCRLPQALPR